MTFEDYITRFRLLRNALENDERLLELVSSEGYHALLGRVEEAPELEKIVLRRDVLEKRIAKRRALYEKYAVRIARAACMISSPPIREYAVCRYLYGFTHESIAEGSFYSVRTLYRHRSTAEKELFRALLSLQGKAKREGRLKGKRFRSASPIPHRTAGVPESALQLLRISPKNSEKMQRFRRRVSVHHSLFG